MNVFENLRGGKHYHIYDDDYKREVHSEIKRCRHLCWLINSTDPYNAEKILELERELFNGNFDATNFLTPPFQIDAACMFTINHEPKNIRVIMSKEILIKRNAWIGARVNILPSVTIDENAIVGTGSIVTKDIPDNAVAVGNPARVVKFIY